MDDATVVYMFAHYVGRFFIRNAIIIVENVAAFARTKPCRVSSTARSSSGKMERILFQNDVGDKTAPTKSVHEDNYTLVESQKH